MPAPNVATGYGEITPKKKSAKKVKAKPKGTLEQRARRDPDLLKRVLANAGLRSKLPASMLTPELRRQREMNERLRRPITPGSSITERDLAKESGSAASVRYGLLEQAQKTGLGEEQARQRDVGGFYDQYLQQIRQHSQNVNNIGATAVNAGLAAQQGIGGIAGADLSQLQGQANAGAAQQGVTPAGNLSPLANAAAAARQALIGSFIAQQGATNAATSNYASGLANAVVPTQKLSAQVQAQGRVRKAQDEISQTAREKGAWEQQFRGERRSEEAKQVLAQQTLGGKLAEDKTQAEQTQQRIEEQERHNRAQEKAANQRMRDQRRKALEDASKAGNKRATSGPFAGLTQNQINNLSDQEARKLVKDHDKDSGGEDKPKGKGPDWVTPGQSGAAMTQLGQLKDFVNRAKTGQPFIAGHTKQKKMTMDEAKKKVLQNTSSLKHPVLLDAATEAVYDRFIHAETVKALIRAGYKPSEVARTLGVPTSQQVRTGYKRVG